MEDNDNRKKATAVAIALFLGVAALGFAIAAMQSDSLLTGDNANDDAAFATVQPGVNHLEIDPSDLNPIDDPHVQDVQITEPDLSDDQRATRIYG